MKFRNVRLLVGAFALTAALPTAAAASPIIWYNGDLPVNGHGLASERNTTISDARVYDDFVLTQATTIDEVFGNELMSSNFPTTAYWEIRSGVSSGNGGTLLYSGTNAATATPTGRSADGFTEYHVDVTGLNLALGPGTYWLTVAAIDSGNGRAFMSLTNGANAIGTPPGNDSNAFFDSTFFGTNFQPTVIAANPEYHDFSMGVAGTLTAVPEPMSLLLVGSGLAAVASSRRKKAE